MYEVFFNINMNLNATVAVDADFWKYISTASSCIWITKKKSESGRKLPDTNSEITTGIARGR